MQENEPKNLQNHKTPNLYRLLEMLPGTLVWGALLGAIILSFASPLSAIYLIIAFDLYWLLRVTYFVFYLTVSWRRYRHDVSITWHEKLPVDFPWSREIKHIIFLPTYKEPRDVIERTFDALIACCYDRKTMIIVLAGEERDEKIFLEMAEALKQRYAHHFYDFLITVHPMGLPDEIPGKGSNMYYAGHRVQEYVDAAGLPYDKLIVSAFDVDTVVHPEYFAYLTYVFCREPDRLRCSYQPVALYNNNMWESNPIVRVASFGTTFWLLTELPRPERLFTFSSHSMSWQALVDVGFWEKRIVSEDSRIFLQCFIRYQGAYRVQPLYIPVSMNTVQVASLWRSLVNLYRQQRRWAWGVENFPYMIWQFFFRKNSIPLRRKFYYFFNLGEGYFTWATAPLLIFILGYLPLYVGRSELGRTALFQNTPQVLKTLLQLAMVGIFLSAFVSLLLLPPRPRKKHRFNFLILLAQWILLPATLIFFGSIPSVDAQTRMMLGKRLGFWVTEKK